MTKRKQVWEKVPITGMADRGKSVGRHADGRVVFVDGAVPGDVADVLILRKKKGVHHGVVQQINIWSADRTDPPCEHFDDCGGCKWQHLNYKAQLQHKQQIVADVMRRIAKMPEIEIEQIIGADPIYYYRNKMEFSFSKHKWKTKRQIKDDEKIEDRGALGLHPPGFFNKVVDVTKCWLQDDQADILRNFIRSYSEQKGLTYFDPLSHVGFLRNMIIRNTTYGDWMFILSVGEPDQEAIDAIMNEIRRAFPWLTSLHYVINQKKNDTLFDQEIICYSGQHHIIEQLGGLKFKIRPKSFFQTNSRQAKTLYDVARDYCDLSGEEVVYDLYTGTGSIALYLAQQCRKVVGIEEVPDAIADAKENAILNGIQNTHFYVGDVKNILKEDLLQNHPRPDIVVTDPPRMGMHEQVVRQIIQLSPDKVVYISCNPATQARDLMLLNENYRVLKMQPVDMFPHTNHIENVALLQKRSL